MNSENCFRFDSKSLRNVSVASETLDSSLIPDKLNPHRIVKQPYTNPGLSQKSQTNMKRKCTTKRAKTHIGTQGSKSLAKTSIGLQDMGNSKKSDGSLQQKNRYQAVFSQATKENLFLENLISMQNNKDSQAGNPHLKNSGFNVSQALSKEVVASGRLEQGSLKLNRFSSYRGSHAFSADSKCPLSQNCLDSKNFCLDDSIPSFKELKGSNSLSQRGLSHLTHDNDYSDRETAEETTSCLSEQIIGSHTRLAKTSLKTENSLERYCDPKGLFCISQEISCCTTLDCEETIGYHSSNLLNDKKEDSILPYDIDFDQEFALFLSASTTPNNKQLGEETTIPETIDSKPLTAEEELAAFNPEVNPCAFDSETISYLIKRENDYAPDPHFIEKKQTQINWSMRAILLDWMMEVSMEFGLKRETYHYAINFVDRYLSAVPPVQKWELQLVGVTAIYTAAKVEEIYPPRVASFAKSTDNAYTVPQILEMELKMFKALKWLLTPPSLNTWANWYMNQWDLYIERSEFARNHPLVLSISQSEDLIQFKQSNQKSYARFREMMQLIDCAVLDSQTLQYKPRALIASIMYVLLGKYFGHFNNQQVYETFPRNSQYLLDANNSFNTLFEDFLIYSFGFELNDLLPSIQYVSTYINLPLSLELPKVANTNKENVLEGHFEEFLAYQTHNPYNLQYIKKRPRNNL